MVEFVTLEGPLERPLLRSIGDLYGRADPKYARDDVLDHLFVKSPAGPGLHAFAVADGRPVGHCAVVPMPARSGSGELRCGKLEALFLEEAYRGGRPGGSRAAVLELLERLYALANDRGIELIYAFVTPGIGRVIGFLPLEGVGRPALVSATRAYAVGGERHLSMRMLAATQSAVGEVVSGAVTIGRRQGVTVRTPTESDVDLVEGPAVAPGRWTITETDSWNWHRASPLVRVLEVSGRDGGRALLQVPGAPGEAIRIIGWRPTRAALVPALVLLRATGHLARSSGAPTLRFQPWASPAGDGSLVRACRLSGFLPRPDFTTLWVRTSSERLAQADAPFPTPLLYLGY